MERGSRNTSRTVQVRIIKNHESKTIFNGYQYLCGIHLRGENGFEQRGGYD